jgi:hypothetical protein
MKRFDKINTAKYFVQGIDLSNEFHLMKRATWYLRDDTLSLKHRRAPVCYKHKTC